MYVRYLPAFLALLLSATASVAQTYPALTVYAGTPNNAGFSGDGGPAANASLYNPWRLATDSKGTLYVADTCNNRIRKIDLSGNITTVAGSGTGQSVCGNGVGYSGDGGAATAAKLNQPTAVAVDS